VLGCVPVPLIDEDVDSGYWRARAERAESLVTELRADKAGLNARVAELAAEVARLSESVTTLSGLLFGSSSEKSGSSLRGNGRGGDDGGDGGVTTPALNRRSLRWFGLPACTANPEGQTSITGTARFALATFYIALALLSGRTPDRRLGARALTLRVTQRDDGGLGAVPETGHAYSA